MGRLPSLQGICSTTTPCSGHCTRRGAYKNQVTIPHSATNSHQRSGSRSYPGAGRRHSEHLPRRPRCGSIRTSMRSLPRGIQLNLPVNKTRKMLNPIQTGLNFQLHRWPLVSFLSRSSHRSETQSQLLFFTCNCASLHPTHQRPTRAVYSQERRAAAADSRTPVRVAAGRHSLYPQILLQAHKYFKSITPPCFAFQPAK